MRKSNLLPAKLEYFNMLDENKVMKNNHYIKSTNHKMRLSIIFAPPE